MEIPGDEAPSGAAAPFASLTPLAGGYSGETFLARTGGQPTVVRLYAGSGAQRSSQRGPDAPEVDAAVLHLVRGLVYPVPDPRYPFLGVHLTPRFDGEVLIGPNAVLALAREGYRRRDVSPRELAEIVRYAGFRRFAARHWRTGLGEMRGSLSKRVFTGAARRYVPELTVSDLVPATAGIRAQALETDGSLVDDFRITRTGSVVAVRNAPSPAATSSLAIAEHIVDALLERAPGS